MSMTRETAAEWFETHMPTGRVKPVQKQAYLLALSALRPVSREQVEKVWRGEWVGVPSMGVYDTVCSKCGYCPGIRFWSSDFCPHCGAPMTDEAVQMVMERLEELSNGKG